MLHTGPLRIGKETFNTDRVQIEIQLKQLKTAITFFSLQSGIRCSAIGNIHICIPFYLVVDFKSNKDVSNKNSHILDQ